MNDPSPPPVVLITGANSGIGQAAATDLARRGWQVFAAARSPERGEAAVAQIQNDSGSTRVELLELDLASFASVRRAAADLFERTNRVDALINNAGATLSDRSLSEDGLDKTNHFGHFLLTSLLLPRLMESDDPRIVNVSSNAYKRAGAMPLDDLRLERYRGAFRRYGVSKLANVLFTRGLHRRYFGSGLATFAVHPGVVRTQFGADGDNRRLAVAVRIIRPFLLSPESGAAPIVELVDAPERRTHAGAYFSRHQAETLNRHAADVAAAEQLWDVSSKLTQATWPDA